MRNPICLILLIILAVAFVYPVSAVLVFSDNFDRQELGLDWNIVRNTWTIETGELNAEGVDGLLTSSQYYVDVSIEVKVRIIDDGDIPSNWMGLIARATHPNDDCWTSGYLVYFRHDGRIELYTYEDNIIAWSQTDIIPDDFVTIRASFIGSNVQVYVNGVRYINVDHSRYSDGYFSLKSQVDHGHFDDVIIENPLSHVIPEPSPLITSLLFLAVFAAYALIHYKKPLFQRRT